MSRRKHKRSRGKEEVELNLAAMLDMAFQLLTFFILTFKPTPVEGQFSLHLPPPQPVTNVNASASAGADTNNTNPVQGLNSLVISAYSTPSGSLATMALGADQKIDNVVMLEGRLRAILGEPGNPFDQVIIQVSSSLRYDELMKIIDVCTRQTLPSGEKLTKLSFVELPER